MRGWIAILALLGGAASAQAPPARQPQAEPGPFPGCDPKDRANARGVEDLLDLGERAVEQVRRVRSGDESTLASAVSPEFTYTVFSYDNGFGENGHEGFRRLARLLGAGRYAIVVPQGLYFRPACYRIPVDVIFSDADGRNAQTIRFEFDGPLLVRATGRVSNGYREGTLSPG